MIFSSQTVTQVIEQTAYTLQWLLYPVQIPVLDMDMHGQPMQKHLFQFGLKYFEPLEIGGGLGFGSPGSYLGPVEASHGGL